MDEPELKMRFINVVIRSFVAKNNKRLSQIILSKDQEKCCCFICNLPKIHLLRSVYSRAFVFHTCRLHIPSRLARCSNELLRIVRETVIESVPNIIVGKTSNSKRLT